MTHLTCEQCNEFVDADSDASGSVARHVEGCDVCRRQVEQLRALREATRRLNREIAPPVELWADVRASIEQGRVTPIRRSWRITPRLAAAAALVLMAASSAVTVVVMRRPVEAISQVVVAVPASWSQSENAYRNEVDALEIQLQAQRDRLSPETVQAVERALGTIDAAIAEARAALVNDPANAAITDLLASNYRQKVELLRRATQLAES